ncbi:glycosyltransferase family 8 protein [Lysinibacillus sp. CNPSo 3705]|uniref:glycosyltransferase family 8 protein n=1 Tax=Lysinibacillus sp. CNPSo 3705 TaxID=3028148 RepID=UPI002363D290|nr:glycosyltransferase family 8 protein [Lysinibacillus sp. CNPSo 3705]MDD1503984.1 glycosyltransferase family 8 protein [Lysinibacillus sp. CNPSo 3705]
MNKINVLTSINKEYIPHMGAMFTSILENSSNIENICLGVIHSELVDNDKKEIDNFFKEKYGVSINYYKVDENEFSELPIIAEHLKIETYFRLAIPKVVSEDINKVIYLDSDMIIRNDIFDLWKIDIENYIVGAVINPLNNSNMYLYKGLGLSDSSDYFNAGVLLINLKEWRRREFNIEINNFIEKKQESIIYADQDALNGAINGNWKRIDERWNMTNNLLDIDLEFQYQLSRTLKEITENPYIVHFTGRSKPWHLFCWHPFKEEYKKYANLTPWSRNQLETHNNKKLKEIIVFGTGKAGEKLSKYLAIQGYEISYYLDNDVSKKDCEFMGKSVYLPNYIANNFSNERMLIIVASQYYDEISKQLNKMGLEENNDYYSINNLELIM